MASTHGYMHMVVCMYLDELSHWHVVGASWRYRVASLACTSSPRVRDAMDKCFNVGYLNYLWVTTRPNQTGPNQTGSAICYSIGA